MMPVVSTIADLVSAAALLIGLWFAVVQLRIFRAAREHEMAVELLRSFQTPQMAAALRAVYNLPEGLTKGRNRETSGGPHGGGP